MTQGAYKTLAQWLDGRIASLRELEEQAREVIEEQGDQAGYERLMREKALLLADLEEQGRDILKEAGGPEADKLRQRLAAFSAGASMALEVGSVFFMSALLYPEDHQPGQPNDLERFAEFTHQLAGSR